MKNEVNEKGNIKVCRHRLQGDLQWVSHACRIPAHDSATQEHLLHVIPMASLQVLGHNVCRQRLWQGRSRMAVLQCIPRDPQHTADRVNAGHFRPLHRIQPGVQLLLSNKSSLTAVAGFVVPFPRVVVKDREDVLSYLRFGLIFVEDISQFCVKSQTND